MLGDLYCSQPLRLLFPLPVEGEIFQAVLACVSGGILGGDHFKVGVRAGDLTEVLVVGQAAEKVYRTPGPDSAIDNNLEIGVDAWLEWLPQETIMFDRARLRRRTTVCMHHNARFLGGEILVFGRAARGEHITDGLIHDGWEIRGADGTLVWKDAFHMEGDLSAQLAETVSFDQARAYGTIVFAHAAAEKLLPALREIAGAHISTSLKIGASLVRNILLVRFLGRDTLGLRTAYADVWRHLVCAKSGCGHAREKMPRLWNV